MIPLYHCNFNNLSKYNKKIVSLSLPKCIHTQTIKTSIDEVETSDPESDPKSRAGKLKIKNEKAELAFANFNEAEIKKLKVIKLEYDVMESTGVNLPEMDDGRWYEIFTETSSISSRRRLYQYWFILDVKRKNEKAKKTISHAIHIEKVHEERKKERDEKGFINKLFFRIRSKDMNAFYYNNLLYAQQFGQPFIIDLGYALAQNKKEMTNCIDQLLMMHGYNKTQKDPFNLIFTNYDSTVHERLKEILGENVPYQFTSGSYLELYPPEKLVYLSPDASHELQSFNYDDVYIMGGLVDKRGQGPLSYAKAKRQGIRSAKLPLSKYVNWKQGYKSLDFMSCMKIMMTVKDSRNDWMKAFKHIPKRKINHFY